MPTQSERLALLEQRLADHEQRCEDRLAEIRKAMGSMLTAVEGLKGRAWGIMLALLSWALVQLWTANDSRLETLELHDVARTPPAATAEISPPPAAPDRS